MENFVFFDDLPVDHWFFDPNTGETFCKVCGNAAEFITGGNYFSGQLATFEPNEFIQPLQRGTK